MARAHCASVSSSSSGDVATAIPSMSPGLGRAARAAGDAERAAAEAAGDDVRDLVPEDRVRDEPSLDVDLAPPRLRDGRVAPRP